MVLLTSLHMGVGGALAGPVSGDDSTAAAADAAPLTSPALATPALGEALTATGAIRAAAPAQADATASPSAALAAEIIKEAQAGAGTAEPTRPAPRPTATTPAARAAPRENADDAALREWGKTAVAWVKQTLPWLRKDEDDERRTPATGLGQADWNESPLDAGKAGRSGRNDALPAVNTAAAPHGPGTSVGYGAAPRATYDPPPNLIREFIDTVRTVLEHPMTWLVGVLVIIGAIAVKKLDRRPTE